MFVPLILMTSSVDLADAASSKRLGAADRVDAAVFFAGGLMLGGFQLLLKPAVYLEYATREMRGRRDRRLRLLADRRRLWLAVLPQDAGYGLGIVLLVSGRLRAA